MLLLEVTESFDKQLIWKWIQTVQLNLSSPLALYLPSLIHLPALRAGITMPFANHLLITHNFQPGSEPESEELNQESEHTDGQL